MLPLSIMPSRNTIRYDVDADDQYYHVYARGASRKDIFLDADDFSYFLSLFARYLDSGKTISKTGVVYPNYSGTIELLAYCQMTNHFHLLVYQKDKGALSSFMRSFMTSYSRYFNLKYKLSGSLFESRYKASLIDDQSYLEHISRYIHMNPRYWKRYPYSSLQFYFTSNHDDWINPSKIEELFTSKKEYIQFLEDYADEKEELAELKYLLADQ